MEEKDKIERVMQEFSMNSAQFAAEIGIQGSTLSHIINGRNRPSLDVLKKIMSRFNTINPEWLILDKEPMFRQEKNSQGPTLFDSIDEITIESDSYAKKTIQKNGSQKDINQKEIVNSPNAPSLEQTLAPQDTAKLSASAQVLKKSPVKIIVYYDDNTFQEFLP
ncbi:MAG: helix-turn-helix transcriptional regulator [Paludibacteraceae bacterium]|nr:helix-turn-helix transcriptional regulator [Paludibacteraceae bacterium]